MDATPGTNVTTFYNVIAQTGSDPCVYRHTDRWYYMTRTTGGDVRLWRSRTFTSFDAAENKKIWAPLDDGPACQDVWAPEIVFLDSKWYEGLNSISFNLFQLKIRYIYFTATTCDGNNDNHRMFVLENTNLDPFNGTFTFKGQITDSTDKWAIDGIAFKHPVSSQLYYLWSGWEGDVNGRQILYIAKLLNPWTIDGERVEIARPNYTWEINRWPRVNEGPQIRIRGSVISLVYSASGSWTNDYCLGLITASTKSNPMNASSWTKRPDPVFQTANDIIAPGHHSFTKSRDGKEDWIIYHSARYNNSGWSRQVRAQKFTWNADSTPNFGDPVDPNTPIRIPSGDPVRTRYEAENADLFDGATTVYEGSASNDAKVGTIDYPNSTILFTVECDVAGSYVVAIRNCNGSPTNTTATQWLSINNKASSQISIIYGGWNRWGVTMFRANLLQGLNTLKLKKGTSFAEIDQIDVFLDI